MRCIGAHCLLVYEESGRPVGAFGCDKVLYAHPDGGSLEDSLARGDSIARIPTCCALICCWKMLCCVQLDGTGTVNVVVLGPVIARSLGSRAMSSNVGAQRSLRDA